MTIKKHKDVIQDLILGNPSIRTSGFKKALIQLVKMKEPDVGDEIDIIKSYIAFVPDAYLIEGEKVTIFEVIDTHKINKDKKWKLAWGWYAIDNFYLDCDLVICDVYGGRNRIDLKVWFNEVVSSAEYPKGWPQAYSRN
jgi:hypothetical protein